MSGWGLQPAPSRQTPGLLVAPAPRLHRPQRRHGRAERARRDRPPHRRTTLRRLEDLQNTTATGGRSNAGSRRSNTSCARCSKPTQPNKRATATPAQSATTCSSSGPRSGPSSRPTASNRPTTTPNADSAAPVAVGTALRRLGSGRPPHRSRRARLTHRAPASGFGVVACVWPRMQDARLG